MTSRDDAQLDELNGVIGRGIDEIFQLISSHQNIQNLCSKLIESNPMASWVSLSFARLSRQKAFHDSCDAKKTRNCFGMSEQSQIAMGVEKDVAGVSLSSLTSLHKGGK
jgi:hypothetical protein